MQGIAFDSDQCKIDNTRVIDFLSSKASAMTEAGTLDEKDADNLRLVLSGLQSASGRPILLEMIEQETEFLAILDARYGPATFHANLLRHTCRPYLLSMLQVISAWGDATLGRAKLTFNRPIFIYQDGECQRLQLLATHLVDFGEELASTAGAIESLLTGWETMYPHDMAGDSDEDRAVDAACASALGFSEVMIAGPVENKEGRELARLASSLAGIADRATNLISTLNRNTGTDTRYPVLVSGDRLVAACRDLEHHVFPSTGSQTTFEVRRLALVGVLNAAAGHLADLAKMTMDAIARDLPRSSAIGASHFPQSARRRLAFTMMVDRTSPQTAWEATDHLIRYMSAQNIAPDALIESELAKIHPALKPKTLQVLQELAADASLLTQSTQQKAKNLSQVEGLAKTFARFSRIAPAALALALMVLPGCGFKKPPGSDQLEPRPEIPYHADPLPTEKNSLKEQNSGATPAPRSKQPL